MLGRVIIEPVWLPNQASIADKMNGVVCNKAWDGVGQKKQ